LSGAEGIVAIVLAAGLASRFGGDKLLHDYRGRPLAGHIADTLAGMGLRRIAVCPPAPSVRIGLFASRGFEVASNAEPGRGLASSLAIGAAAAIASGADRALVCLADMPNVTVEHLWRLLAESKDHAAVATSAAGIRSPPAVFTAALLPGLTRLTGDTGARDLLRSAAAVEADAALVRDFDVPGDFAWSVSPLR
jgi:molybdenum cofactor cytidylyltransferase